jgi:hypothetical protein
MGGCIVAKANGRGRSQAMVVKKEERKKKRELGAF